MQVKALHVVEREHADCNAVSQAEFIPMPEKERIRLSSGASAKDRRTRKARKPIGSKNYRPGLKPWPPKRKGL